MRAIVLAGGSGTRLWPLSREDFPKQFLRFGSKLSLLQKTVERLAKAPFITEVVVATNTYHKSLVEEQLGKLESKKKVHILVEPMRKNTAAAIGLAIRYLETFCNAKPEDPILVLPSDHVIDPEEAFLEALLQMQPLAKNHWLITFGIRPSRAETGFGYIEFGEREENGAFTVERFIEKPNQTVAEQLMLDPKVYWNSGMLLFSTKTFWQEIKTYVPEMNAPDYDSFLKSFESLPNISIDYALMEKSNQILACPLSVQWSDVGSWDSVYDILDKDQHQNAKEGKVVTIDTKNSLILGGKRLISTIGLQDMLIVDTADAIFIGKKGHSQEVRALVEGLQTQKAQQPEEILEITPRYTIKKITLKPRESITVQGKWMAIEKEPLVLNERLINPSEESLELLIVE